MPLSVTQVKFLPLTQAVVVVSSTRRRVATRAVNCIQLKVIKTTTKTNRNTNKVSDIYSLSLSYTIVFSRPNNIVVSGHRPERKKKNISQEDDLENLFHLVKPLR